MGGEKKILDFFFSSPGKKDNFPNFLFFFVLGVGDPQKKNLKKTRQGFFFLKNFLFFLKKPKNFL